MACQSAAINPQIVPLGLPLQSTTKLWEKDGKEQQRTSMISVHVVSCLHCHARWTNMRGARRMLYARAAHGRYPPQTTAPRMHGWAKTTSLFIRLIQFKIHWSTAGNATYQNIFVQYAVPTLSKSNLDLIFAVLWPRCLFTILLIQFSNATLRVYYKGDIWKR